jgi:hypothetical protein
MTVAVIALLSLFTVPQTIRAPAPDFTGRWIAISPGYEGREVRIARTRTTLTVTQTFNRRSETAVYNLVGTPRRESRGPDEERWLTAAWNGAALRLTDTLLTRTAEERVEQTLSLDTARRLIIGINRSRLNANRDPSAPLPPPQSKTVIVLKKRPA